MAKNRNKHNGIFGIMGGLIIGIAGTAFSMGADRQRIDDALSTHTSNIAAMKTKQVAEIASRKSDEDAHKKATQNELDRLAKIMASQISLIQSGINRLSDKFGELRTDVHVLKALMERMENDLKKKD